MSITRNTQKTKWKNNRTFSPPCSNALPVRIAPLRGQLSSEIFDGPFATRGSERQNMPVHEECCNLNEEVISVSSTFLFETLSRSASALSSDRQRTSILHKTNILTSVIPTFLNMFSLLCSITWKLHAASLSGSPRCS